MNKKRISVIIPVYNREQYLGACINSVLNQIGVNTEIILIDDGSTDSSGTICDKYSTEHDNILVFHTTNHGVSHARNVGLDNATGDYVCFLDSDDTLNINSLVLLQNALENNNADYSIGQIEFYNTSGESITKTFIPAHYLNRALNKYEFLNVLVDADSRLVVYITSRLYKINLWKTLRFDESVPVSEDELTLPFILEKSEGIVIIGDVVYNVTNSEKSLMRSRSTPSLLCPIDSNFAVHEYCYSVGNYNAALFKFGYGTRKLLYAKNALKFSGSKTEISKRYKEYRRYAKKLATHASFKGKLQLFLFYISFNLYDLAKKILR